MRSLDACRTFLRTILAALIVVLPAVTIQAAAQERWAVLSVIGDRMNLVYARMQTGTRTNPNLTEPLMMKEDVLDRLALNAVLNASVPGKPEVMPLALRDPRFYQAQERLFASDGKPLLDGLLKALEAQKITHVLLLTRMRGEATFKVSDGHIGIGNVEGLGFYIDRGTMVQSGETGKVDRGYLAPFAYYKLMLFEVTSSAVVAEARVAASTTYPVASSGETDPWVVVSPQQKVDDLEKLLNQNMGGALERLAAARKSR